MGFQVDKINEHVAITRLSGRIDVMSSHILRSNFELVSRQGYRFLVVDLGEVSFLDSSGLSALVSGLRHMRNQGGTLVLAQPNERVEATLRLTNFHRFFAIYDEMEQALQALTKAQESSPSVQSPYFSDSADISF